MNQVECKLEHHDKQKIKYLCLDSKCTAQKLGCADCFLEEHVMHHRMAITNFQKELSAKIDSLAKVEVESVQNDDSRVEEEIQGCQDQISQRLALLKDDIKSIVNVEIENYGTSVECLKNSVNETISPLLNVSRQAIGEMSNAELEKAVRFYQDSSLIQDNLRKQLDELDSQREKVKLKREKVLSKLHGAIENILRELDEQLSTREAVSTIKKRVQFSDDLQGTPEKPTQLPACALQFSGCSTTQSPPVKNLIEAARSKKYPINKQSFNKKLAKQD